MAGVPACQLLKYQIDRVFELLIVLPHLHGVYHLNEGGEVLLLHRRFVPEIADEGGVEQGFRLAPEIVAALAVPLRVGDEGRDQLQNVLLAVDVGEGVIVHTLFEVDRVYHLDTILVAPEQMADLADQSAFRVGDDEGNRPGVGGTLHEIWLDEKARLA